MSDKLKLQIHCDKEDKYNNILDTKVETYYVEPDKYNMEMQHDLIVGFMKDKFNVLEEGIYIEFKEDFKYNYSDEIWLCEEHDYMIKVNKV